MNKLWVIITLVIAALGLSTLIVVGGDMVKGYDPKANAGSGADVGTPWQIDPVPEGRTRVAGLLVCAWGAWPAHLTTASRMTAASDAVVCMLGLWQAHCVQFENSQQ